MKNNKYRNKEATWSIYQFMLRFPNEKTARKHIENIRWGDNPICPHCGEKEISDIKNEKPMPYRCKKCRKHFSVRTKTVFQSSNLPLHKCLLAIYLLTTAKKGIPSTQLARELGITQKTAWHLAHRIRKSMEQNNDLLKGEIEVDESYIGGKEKNKHRKKRLNMGRGAVGKTAVIGMLERNGEVKANPIWATNKTALQSSIKSNIKLGSTVYTDEWKAYNNMNGYVHQKVKHSVGQFVKGMAHTNGIESFWALLKRGYYGVYHKMEVKHLHRYIDEFVTRHNLRSNNTEQNINYYIRSIIGKSLTYKELIT